jgi:hypothetical protein
MQVKEVQKELRLQGAKVDGLTIKVKAAARATTNTILAVGAYLLLQGTDSSWVLDLDFIPGWAKLGLKAAMAAASAVLTPLPVTGICSLAFNELLKSSNDLDEAKGTFASLEKRLAEAKGLKDSP